MSVIRLADGGLVVHSPIRIDETLAAAVDALGRVVAIVAPSKFHHLSVSQWSQRYPDALVTGCPGITTKRDDIGWDRVLGDEPESVWAGQLDQVYFGARSLEDEVVFYHRRSQTMICADTVFNLGQHSSLLTRCVASTLGARKAGVTLLERLLVRDRSAARTQVDRMLDWEFDRMVVGHGPNLPTGAHEVLRRAYAWL